MNVGEQCTRNVITATKECGIVESAKLMRQHHVGSLIIVSEHHDGARPVGILTDRDLVIEVLALDVPLDSVTVGDVMTSSLVFATEDDDLFETMEKMREKGIRRLPVTDEIGRLVGILTADDLLVGIYEQLGNMVSLITHEQLKEFRTRTD
jgi:CBS domain-containing protein